MDDKLLRYTLRVDRLLFQKFRYIAESEGRSANKEIEQYLKKRVAEYEAANGKIEINHKLFGRAIERIARYFYLLSCSRARLLCHCANNWIAVAQTCLSV